MAATAHFKGAPGRTYGFTNEDGEQVTRRAGDDGIVRATSHFEERHFAGLGLAPAEPGTKSRKSTKKRSSKKKAAAAKAEAAPTPAPTANEEAAPPADKE